MTALLKNTFAKETSKCQITQVIDLVYYEEKHILHNEIINGMKQKGKQLFICRILTRCTALMF